MLAHYLTVKGLGLAELEINKSKFIAATHPAQTEPQALEVIAGIKKQHANATHNCSAYVIGLQEQLQKADDDGEPSATAGKPILEVIKKNELKNIVIVVTRYFGGIKLGSGGLIRAYGRAASAAIEAAGVIEKRLHSRLAIDIDYALLGSVENLLHAQHLSIEGKEFTDRVRLIALVPKGHEQPISLQLTELTAAQAAITVLGETYLRVNRSC